MRPAYPIETERLLLRPLDPDADVAAVHAYQSRPDVCRYVSYSPRSLDEVAKALALPERTRASLEEEGDYLDLAMVRRDTAELIGDVLLFWRSAEHRAGELGYALNPDHHGHGYATEASVAMLALAFEQAGLHRVYARIDQRNDASAAVLRRLGMRQEAVLVDNEWFKGEWSTEVDFAILDREWRGTLR